MTGDTPQQKAVLRQCASARRTRHMFPIGTRVEGAPGRFGTVLRHVPGVDAQGGYLVVKWEDGSPEGHIGRPTPAGLTIVQGKEQER